MYRDTITLFNRKVEDGGSVWRATVLHGVDLNADKGYMRRQYGDSCTDTAKLHVAFSGDGNVNGYQFVEPIDYQDLDSTAGYITFQSGEDFDFFWQGDWDGDVVIEDNAYTAGFYDYMHRNHANVFVVTSYAKYSVIPHFEVYGK